MKESKFKERAEKVSHIIQDHPRDYRAHLEELGFEWVDDDGEIDLDAEEEAKAKAENPAQAILVQYFGGKTEFKDILLETFLSETEYKNEDEVNYPLFRRYFKQGNQPLLDLLIKTHAQEPDNLWRLSNLNYFHEHRPILGILVKAYQLACDQTQDLMRLKEVLADFYHYAGADGYDVDAGLAERFRNQPEKLKVWQEVLGEIKNGQDSVISF